MIKIFYKNWLDLLRDHEAIKSKETSYLIEKTYQDFPKCISFFCRKLIVVTMQHDIV